MAEDQTKERNLFESTIQAMEAEIANVAAHLSLDGATREAYASQIRAMAEELRQQALSGRTTWAQAAEQAQSTRNMVLELMRSRSTPVGRALAEQLKREGRTLNELIARKTQHLHGPYADFKRLTPSPAERGLCRNRKVRWQGEPACDIRDACGVQGGTRLDCAVDWDFRVQRCDLGRQGRHSRT